MSSLFVRRDSLATQNFAEALWHCCQSWRALDSMIGVGSAAHLMRTVTDCYECISSDIDGQVLALCQQFDGAAYIKVNHPDGISAGKNRV